MSLGTAPAPRRTALASVYLRLLEQDDEEEFLGRARASRVLHAPWVHPPTTAKRFREYVEGLSRPVHRGFLVCRRGGHNEITGVIELTHIVMGALRSAYLGYYMFAGFEGQGYMSAGLRAVVRRAFGEMKLHRLEANIQPGNHASIALARACGFSREGLSPRYLRIGGRWCDHERWAILAD
jgi:ribosomal-protein-alanine N-acetyltransferase